MNERPLLPTEARLSRLIDTYLEKRDALVRYFTGRLGSESAAEDVVQDIYLKLRTLDSEVVVHSEAAFLYRLGTNLMLDRLRQRRRAAARDGDWHAVRATLLDGDEVAEEPPADEAAASRQRLALMVAALDELPPAHRDAFRLHKMEGLSQVETATTLGVSLSTVEKHLRAALKHLAARLG